MNSFRTLGDEGIKREFTRAHGRRLRRWFDRDGAFRHHGTNPSSREHLWNCFSLLLGRPDDIRLANRIILSTPIDNNHFLPINAAELALRFPTQLWPAARRHLVATARAHYVNMLEWRFGTNGMHNFVCMTTWFLLAAPRLFGRYEFKHRFASIPEVYSRERMREAGMNALKLLWHEWEHSSVSSEFNSPTYSAISLMATAKVVEFISDPLSRSLALRVEAKLWRELFAFYHPHLNLACGPYSRAYRVDVLGQVSCLRMLLSYIGLSRDRSVAALLNTWDPDILLHHDGDAPFNWAQAAWLMSTKYHVPTDALDGLQRRVYPKRFQSRIKWPAFGLIDKKHKQLVSVQGPVLPGGESEIIQIQHRTWSLGFRRYTVWGHSFPIHLHYPIAGKISSMRDVRNILCAVMFQGKPAEWTQDQRGQPIETSNFNHAGKVSVAGRGDGLVFEGIALTELAAIPTDECSINTLISTHFAPVTKVMLNGRCFDGTSIALRGKTAVLSVNDHGFQYTVEYCFERTTAIRFYRWAKFLRFAGFFYEGELKAVPVAELARMRIRGRLWIGAPSDAEPTRRGGSTGYGRRAWWTEIGAHDNQARKTHASDPDHRLLSQPPSV